MSNTIDGSTVQIDGIRFRQASGDPAAPAASHWLLYTKAGGLYIEDSSSVVTGPFGTGGGGGDSVRLTLVNGSGVTVNAGDLVYIPDGNNNEFTTDTVVAGSNYFPGIVYDTSIINGASGLVTLFGLAPVSNLDASASQGDNLVGSSSSGQATPHTMTGFDAGDFGIALESGTTPPVLLFGLPVQRNERVLNRVNGVDLNTATAQQLYVCPASRSCIITQFVVRNASTSLTTVSFSIGWNSTSFNDVLANATHTELTGSTLYSVLPAKAGAAVGTAAGVLKLKNNTTQGGAATCTIDVMGYLF